MNNKILMIITTIVLTIWMCFSSCNGGTCTIYYFQENGFKSLTNGYYKEHILRLETGDTIFISDATNRWVGYPTDYIGIIDTIICND